jgi:uncharacterized membrane protein
MTSSAPDRIWLDARVRPNCAMTQRGLAWVALALLAPSLFFGVVLAVINAWPASLFMGAEAILACGALYLCAWRLQRQSERVILTDESLIVEAWDQGTLVSRETIEPTWVRVDRCMHPDFGCEAIFVRARQRAMRVGAALSPKEREGLADALERALRRRRAEFSAAA